MTARLIAGATAVDPRLGLHVLTLASLGSALIVIASGINNLSFGLMTLGCESFFATVCDAAMHLRHPQSAETPATELLSA